MGRSGVGFCGLGKAGGGGGGALSRRGVRCSSWAGGGPGCGDWPWGDSGWGCVSPPAGPEGVSWASWADQGLVSLPIKGEFSGTLLAATRN